MTCIAPPATFRARAIAARTVTLNLDPAGRALLGGDYAAAVQHLEAALEAPAQPAFDLSMIQQALASRDEQIAELQQAVIELAEQRPAATAEDPARDELAAALEDANGRVAALETRLAEQEQAIRHVLTMLIEWLESEQKPRLAA